SLSRNTLDSDVEYARGRRIVPSSTQVAAELLPVTLLINAERTDTSKKGVLSTPSARDSPLKNPRRNNVLPAPVIVKIHAAVAKDVENECMLSNVMSAQVAEPLSTDDPPAANWPRY
ncbi:hypothetical protein ABS825_27695, partial [Klebsiella pneumoniae]